MGRIKKYIRGRVYITNDHVLVKNSKSNRRIVALNNDKNNMEVRLYIIKMEKRKTLFLLKNILIFEKKVE